MIRGKCVSSVLGFDTTKWPTYFVAVPIIGNLVYQLPTVVGDLNTYTIPAITESVTHLTVSAVAHRQSIFLGGSGYYWEAYVEVTLS